MQKDKFQIEQINENKSQGFIKLYRSFMGWEWYDDTNTKALFLHCLLRANYENVKWHGIDIPRGAFLTSVATLKEELKLSTQNIKTALKHLSKVTNEITIKTTPNYSIITVNNFDFYNPSNKQNNEEATNEQQTDNNEINNEQQTDNKEITTDKKKKKNKKNKENKEEKKTNFVAKSFFQKLIAEDKDAKKYISFSDSFMRFLQYKTDIKKQYKTGDSVKNAFLKFARLANNDINYGVALVDNAIARGWQSIYDLPKEDKIAFKKSQNQNQSASGTDWERYLD